MNHRLWEQHLLNRLHTLERDLQAARERASREHRRAELWRRRALLKHSRRA